MAMANDNMSEGLKKLLRQVADLMVLPDADLQFLTQLQGVITEYVRAQSAALAGAATGTGPESAISGLMPPSGAEGMGGMGGMGGMPPMGGPPGGGNMGLNPGPMAADDLRRVLTSSGG